MCSSDLAGSQNHGLGIEAEFSATVLESVLESERYGVLVLGKREPVPGRVGRIWIIEVGRVSSGVQDVAGFPQQY